MDLDSNPKMYFTHLSMNDAIDKALDCIRPYDIAIILYKLNSDKYYTKGCYNACWADKSDENIPNDIIVSNLKKEISTKIRRIFMDYESILPNDSPKNANCNLLVNYCLTHPKYKNDIIREARELFYC